MRVCVNVCLRVRLCVRGAVCVCTPAFACAACGAVSVSYTC